jgi:flagellar basal body-associated protein FliL
MKKQNNLVITIIIILIILTAGGLGYFYSSQNQHLTKTTVSMPTAPQVPVNITTQNPSGGGTDSE